MRIDEVGPYGPPADRATRSRFAREPLARHRRGDRERAGRIWGWGQAQRKIHRKDGVKTAQAVWDGMTRR